MKKLILFFLGILLFTFHGSSVEAYSVKSAHTQIELVASHEAVTPGQTIAVGIHFVMDGDWHVYYKNPGESGLPPDIEWQVPQGASLGPIHWPPYQVHVDSGISTNVYYQEVILSQMLTLPDDLPLGEPLTVKADVKWLACDDVCIPGQGVVELTLPVIDQELIPARELPVMNEIPDQLGDDGVFSSFLTKRSADQKSLSTTIVIALLFAFIGGMLLNLMPCVLPVLSIKVLGLVEHADDKKAAWKSGLMFTAGVVSSLWVLAGLLLALRFAGEQIGWGFQFQSPLFLVFLCCLLFMFGLNLFGVFEIGTSLTTLEGKVKKGSGLGASFMTGVLATIVATPCTAPFFMGPALGFAMVQPPIISLLIFTLLGLGMAFPYLMLAKFTSLLKFVPKPGPWMVTFKQCLGFLLLGTVVWLLWVLGLQLGSTAVVEMLGMFVLIGFGLWLYGVASYSAKPKNIGKLIAVVLVIAAIVGAFVMIHQTPRITDKRSIPSDVRWQPYDPIKVKQLIKKNQPVFVDYTAAWCLTCQVNKKVALEKEAVLDAFEEKGVHLFRADWTNADPVITQALEEFGRNSVPYYTLYDNQGKLHVLPELLNVEIVLHYIEKL